MEQTALVTNKDFPFDTQFLLDYGLFPTEAYQHGDVRGFFRQVKIGNLKAVHKMVEAYPLLVF